MTVARTVEPARCLGEFIAGSAAVALPDDTEQRIRLLVLDTLGCGLLGATMPWTAPLIATVAGDEPSGAATVWGTGVRASASQAALANGTSVHACEFDDVGAGGHHGSTTITVALALAESGAPLSGTHLIRAVGAGIEVGARIADCLGLTPQARCGFHLPSLTGAFAASATAAAVLGLTAPQATTALATAAQSAAGLLATQHGGMGKRLAAGLAAAAGLRSAQLAAHGFEAATEVLAAGRGGFFAAVSGGEETFALERLTNGLGTEQRALGVSIKLWACRIPIHGALDAFAALSHRTPFASGDIERIEVTLPAVAVEVVGQPYEQPSAAAAQLNLRYCLAALAIQGDVSIAQFAASVLDAPAMRDFMARIDVRADTETDRSTAALTGPATVVVQLRDGRRLSATGRPRLGDDRPPTADEVYRKFKTVTSAVISTERRAAIADACARLGELDSVDRLARLLAVDDAATVTGPSGRLDSRLDSV